MLKAMASETAKTKDSRTTRDARGDAERRNKVAEELDRADIADCESVKGEPARPLRDVLKKLGIEEREVGL